MRLFVIAGAVQAFLYLSAAFVAWDIEWILGVGDWIPSDRFYAFFAWMVLTFVLTYPAYTTIGQGHKNT